MKITALDTYFLSAPLPQAVRTSTSTISRVSELIVRLTTDAGLVGIGEAHGPFLSQGGPEAMRVVKQILERITPLVVGQDPFGAERIWQDLFALTRSEEHTSELQSLAYLVCRLLLEKKNT